MRRKSNATDLTTLTLAMNHTNNTESQTAHTLILGIGNLVLQDEGFGIHAIQKLSRMDVPAGIDLLDGGTAGLHLMGNLRNYKRVIVIDASLDQYPPGTVRRLRPNYGQFPPLVTAHEIGLKDTLEAMQLTGFCPDVELIVCSVRRYTRLGTDLSPEVAAALTVACEQALAAATSAS